MRTSSLGPFAAAVAVAFVGALVVGSGHWRDLRSPH